MIFLRIKRPRETSSYHDFQMQVLEKYKTLEPLDALDILTAPENMSHTQDNVNKQPYHQKPMQKMPEQPKY